MEIPVPGGPPADSVNFPDEFLEFAGVFAVSYKTLDVPMIITDKSGFEIFYRKSFVGDSFLQTPCRIYRETGTIEFNKSVLVKEDFSSDFVYFLCLWCYAQVLLKDHYASDMAAMRYMITEKKLTKELLGEFYKEFSKWIKVGQEIDRFKKIEKFIEWHNNETGS